MTQFMDVVDELLDEETGGITSKRALARRLAELTGTSFESQRRALKRYADGVTPKESTIASFAQAFGVERSRFPEARRPRLGELAAQVAYLAEVHVEHERLLRELDARLRVLEAPRERSSGVPTDPTAETPQ